MTGGSEIVGDGDFRDPSEEAKGVDMGLDPGGEILGEGGLSEGVVGGHEDLSFRDDASWGINDRDRSTRRIVDKELLSAPVFLTKAGIQLFGPLMVEVAELAVVAAVGIDLLLLVPQKLKSNALFLHLTVKVLHGRHLTFLLTHRGWNRKQLMLQGGFIEVGGERPS